MDWKEFFKRGRKKYIVFAILLFVFYEIVLYMPEGSVENPVVLFGLLILSPIFTFVSALGRGSLIGLGIAIFGILVWYAISCLIVLIYDKLKGENK